MVFNIKMIFQHYHLKMNEIKESTILIYLALAVISVVVGISFIASIYNTEKAIGITGFMNYYPYNETWWDDDYRYRISVNVSSGQYDRNDYPIEIHVDFTDELANRGTNQDFDVNSVRVIEHDAVGYVVDAGPGNKGIYAQFEPDSDFNANTNAAGKVVWVMDGNTDYNTIRYFYIYFQFTHLIIILK